MGSSKNGIFYSQIFDSSFSILLKGLGEKTAEEIEFCMKLADLGTRISKQANFLFHAPYHTTSEAEGH